MAQKVFQFILSANTRGWQSVSKAQQGLRAFHRELGSGNKLMASARQQIGALVGAYLGFNALRNTATIVRDANSAVFQLESSLLSASREFENVGSMDSWGAAVDRLSEKLRVYSRTDINTAAARTVDMTKRLGLSADEMERVIEMSGELAAGKDTLEGAVERVTAALRGEAESAEYLGLTLNENYVKSWYEASEAHQKAWKDLTDLEKAHARYQVFLEQATPLQGKAAASTKTLAGAYAEVKAVVSDAINNNEELTEVMAELAEYLSENADEIGELAAGMARGVIAVSKFIIENRQLIAVVGLSVVALGGMIKVVTTLATVWKAFNAASLAVTGTRLLPWLAQLRTATLTAAGGTGALATALRGGLALAAAQGVINIGRLVKAIWEWRSARKMAAEAEAQAAAAEQKFQDRLKKISEESGVVVTSFKEMRAAFRAGAIEYDESTDTYRKGSGKIVQAVKEGLQQQKEITGDELKKMEKQYQEFVDQVKKLMDEIAGRRQSLTEQLREMGRTGMGEGSAWRDLKREAEEYYQAAVKAQKAGDLDQAVEFADKAREKYAELNREVKEGDRVIVSQQAALKTASDGVKRAGELAIDVLEQQKDKAAEAAKALDVAADGRLSQSVIEVAEGIGEVSAAGIDMGDTLVDQINRFGVEAAREFDDIERWLNSPHKMTIEVDKVEKHSTGGVAGLSGWLRRRGKLPGWGGGDKIKALLEAGEIIINKYAVRKFGAARFLRYNAGLEPVRAALGGQVLAQGLAPLRALPAGSAPGALDTVRLELAFAGGERTSLTGSRRQVAQTVRELRRFARRSS
ncbi:MAG: hypothetical protein KQH59_18485 [Desulfobulbaceae bacterium]|nr:hypothetical protein [Desulfobulbaceae bacterium]